MQNNETAPAEALQVILKAAVHTALRPFVHLLVRNGVDYVSFEDETRQVCVRVALKEVQQEHPGASLPRSVGVTAPDRRALSRLALLTKLDATEDPYDHLRSRAITLAMDAAKDIDSDAKGQQPAPDSGSRHGLARKVGRRCRTT